jgi:peroxiredoxin Q/BCP
MRALRRLTGLFALLGFATSAAALSPGDPAPAIALKDQHGKLQQLAQYRGRWVVVYFYPKDDTPGCTTEACQFRDDLPALRALNVQILGVSLDDEASHARFANKYNLPFPLLADTDSAVATAYGALWSAGPIRFARRHTFLIDPEGRIARVYRNVTPKTHSREIQDDIRALIAARQGKP